MPSLNHFRTQVKLFDELAGERVLVRPYRVEDAEALREAVEESREHIRAWLPFADAHQTIEETRDWITHTIAALAATGEHGDRHFSARRRRISGRAGAAYPRVGKSASSRLATGCAPPPRDMATCARPSHYSSNSRCAICWRAGWRFVATRATLAVRRSPSVWDSNVKGIYATVCTRRLVGCGTR